MSTACLKAVPPQYQGRKRGRAPLPDFYFATCSGTLHECPHLGKQE